MCHVGRVGAGDGDGLAERFAGEGDLIAGDPIVDVGTTVAGIRDGSEFRSERSIDLGGAGCVESGGTVAGGLAEKLGEGALEGVTGQGDAGVRVIRCRP